MIFINSISLRNPVEYMVEKPHQKERYPYRTVIPGKYDRESQPFDMFTLFPGSFFMELFDVNIIVGENGSGKSSLLGMFRSYVGERPKDLFMTTQEEYDDNILKRQKENNLVVDTEYKIMYKNTIFFDGEEDNPVTALPKHINPYDKNQDFAAGVYNLFMAQIESHGESMIPILDYILDNAKGIIVFMDEPETALSLKNQIRLANKIKEASKRNNQFIISTHSLAIMNEFDDVFDMESRKWMYRKKYVESIYNK